MDRKEFRPLPAQEIARAFEEEGVDYLFIGKSASRRQKDQVDLPLLESFRVEYENRHSKPLRSALDIAAEKPLRTHRP
jgi:hypothetical protein